MSKQKNLKVFKGSLAHRRGTLDFLKKIASYLEAPFLLPAKSALDPETEPVTAGNLLPLTRYLAASKNSLKSFSYSLQTEVR